MYAVDFSKYPKIREWDTKVLSIPKIPRGSNGYQETLKVILNALIEEKPYSKPIDIEGSNRKDTLEDQFVFLNPTGIVRKNIKGRWEMSEEAENWLKSEDNLYLAAILNANIKFFSEILYILSKQPAQIKKIRDIAINNYKLPWKQKQEILNRLAWLRDLNLINYEDFSHSYSITELGEKLLNSVGYFDHNDIVVEIDSTINENEIPISDWALNLCKLTDTEKKNKKNGIGYLPGNVKSLHHAAYEYLLLMHNPTEISNIIDYSAETYQIKKSSVNSILTTLSHLDFINRISRTKYQTSELGRKFPTKHFEIDFACCVNDKYNFVFEILGELFQQDLNIKQLATIGNVSYNFSYKSYGELRKRLYILQNAKLIQEKGIDTYALTNRGKNFCSLIKDYIPIKNIAFKSKNEASIKNNSNSIDECLNEIFSASEDSTNHSRFEKSLKTGFQLLGFKVEHLGNSGETDLVLQAPTAPKFAYTVTVDAKATYHSTVSENAIDFDTIIEHKNKHKADFAIIVGRGFEGKRLISRAENRGVALLDINTLGELIKKHADIPLKTDSYRQILMQKGLSNLNVLENDRNKIIREGKLLKAIVKCLSDQSNDPYTQGIVQPREIYLLLKGNTEFTTPPTLDEIKHMLELISSPLIDCIRPEKEGYYAVGSLSDAAQKFEFYLKTCNS